MIAPDPELFVLGTMCVCCAFIAALLVVGKVVVFINGMADADDDRFIGLGLLDKAEISVSGTGVTVTVWMST